MLFALSLAGVACGPPPYTMEAPDALKRFERSDDFRYISADGVMLEAREVENYPEADLDFWADAMKRHMVASGYAVKDERRFETERGLPGHTLELMLPHGAEDWVLSETVFVVGEVIVLVEAAAPFERFAALEEDLAAALKTFTPNL